MKPFWINVPASSANFGPGFDSMGLALGLHLTLEVTESDEWVFEQLDSTVPTIYYEDHFIYKISKQVADRHHKELPACRVVEKSNIPLARGLGSSASAILAGIEIANQACRLGLSSEDKLRYGTEIEGHPDNIAPALFGGLVISATIEDVIERIELHALDIDIVVYIPEVELKTEASRKILPSSYPRSLAAAASAVSNVVVASLLKGDYKRAGKMMEHDLFHEPYRAALIPNYEKIRKQAKELSAYGTIISGAGPTMLSIVPSGEGQAIASKMQEVLPYYQVKALAIDPTGMTVE
ncbi:homoserine kinase [Oceanobacillus bengalensis]|uniref:Homoserine kinase n=1 Tax=Oceanobacillus bengalensis TaxID=1435466 RepID=A0A494Z2N9_9BACI|nr:homoserine kinase [Oceanobacillus bengalensis]RKQ16790.1 homoserine kinase [Oceanobacillus bengalensis]